MTTELSATEMDAEIELAREFAALRPIDLDATRVYPFAPGTTPEMIERQREEVAALHRLRIPFDLDATRRAFVRAGLPVSATPQQEAVPFAPGATFVPAPRRPYEVVTVDFTGNYCTTVLNVRGTILDPP